MMILCLFNYFAFLFFSHHNSIQFIETCFEASFQTSIQSSIQPFFPLSLFYLTFAIIDKAAIYFIIIFSIHSIFTQLLAFAMHNFLSLSLSLFLSLAVTHKILTVFILFESLANNSININRKQMMLDNNKYYLNI